MTGILDRVARASFAVHEEQFRPATPRHYFALCLAQHLNDSAVVHHYVELSERYSEAQLLTAYRRVKANGFHDPARAFHVELERLGNRNGNGLNPRCLTAIRIERRAIAVAIFNGDELAYPPIARQLPSDPNKALGSAANFIDRIREKCVFTEAAMEALPAGCEAQRSQLARTVSEILRDQDVSILQVAKADVLATFGYPPLRFRNQVREAISAMWSDVDDSFGSPLIKDALALGLYCQTEYLFNL